VNPKILHPERSRLKFPGHGTAFGAFRLTAYNRTHNKPEKLALIRTQKHRQPKPTGPIHLDQL